MLPNIVLFAGIDANNGTGLWVTNGTAAGTFELTTSGQPPVPGTPPITGEAPYGFLPDPPWSLDLTVFNDQVLFVGRYGQTNYGSVDHRRYGRWHSNWPTSPGRMPAGILPPRRRQFAGLYRLQWRGPVQRPE